jgi:hypothetical protein
MLTELDIINSMLRTIGIDGLTSTDTDHPDYLEAQNVLRIARTQVNKLGYWYNTSYPSLAANADDEIILPSNALSSDSVDRRQNYVKRGNKLFDMDNRTYKIGKTVQVKLVEDLSIDLLPETAKLYIMAVARYTFYGDNEGDANRVARLEHDRLRTWQEFYREHLRNRDINHRDSPAAQRIRRGTRTGTFERQVGGVFR